MFGAARALESVRVPCSKAVEIKLVSTRPIMITLFVFAYLRGSLDPMFQNSTVSSCRNNGVVIADPDFWSLASVGLGLV